MKKNLILALVVAAWTTTYSFVGGEEINSNEPDSLFEREISEDSDGYRQAFDPDDCSPFGSCKEKCVKHLNSCANLKICCDPKDKCVHNWFFGNYYKCK